MSILPSNSHSNTWFNEPIAVYRDGYDYYGIYGDTGIVGVAKYDREREIIEVGHPRGSTAAAIAVDDHNNPAVLALSNGKILSAYSEHPGKGWASLSAADADVLAPWTETQVADGSTLYNSYAHLAQTTDALNTIWYFFRRGQNTTGGMPICVRLNQNGGEGADWQEYLQLISNQAVSNMRPYFRIAPTGRRIDICYTDGQPDEISTNSLYHCYLEIAGDGLTFSAYKSDGTLIDTWAITGGTGTVNSKSLPFAVADGTKIYDGSTNECWIWDVQRVNGTLYACYPVFSQTSAAGDTHLYRRATYNGTSWTHEDICYAGDSEDPETVGRVPQWIYPDASTAQKSYSPGICSDPYLTDVVHLGKKYGDGDVRMQTWTKSAGTWGKTADLTGASGNSRVNARPHPVLGSPTSQAWGMSASTYTTYLNLVSVQPWMVSPLTLAQTAKQATPVWTPDRAPAGTVAFYLLGEGEGAAIADLTGDYDATVNGGSLTWGSDDYGANITGFTSSIAIIADSLAASGLFDTGVFPKWACVLYKSTAATTGQYLLGFGNSGSANPIFGITINNTADNQAGGNYRDAANTQNQISVTSARDANWHTAMIIVESASAVRVFGDGKLLGSATNTLSTVAFNRFTIGALRRTTQGSAASGCVIGAVRVGSGSFPSPIHEHIDLINGQFGGSWEPPALQSATIRRVCPGILVS